VWFLSWFSLFWYQTIDAIDGKQARRTDNCSPLGQLLDHNLDQISFTIFMCMACALLQTGGNIWIILAITPGVMAAHYSIEYRTHFTGIHYTVVGMIGATEQLCIFMTATLVTLFHPLNNDFSKQSVVIPYFDYETTYGTLIWVFVGLTGY
jgi:ethanolaminephosphotransferase